MSFYYNYQPIEYFANLQITKGYEHKRQWMHTMTRQVQMSWKAEEMLPSYKNSKSCLEKL